MESGMKNAGKILFALSMVFALSFSPVFSAEIFGNSANLIVRELKYDPYPLQAGKYVTLWIKLDNFGSEPAENATCELVPKYPFSLDPMENATKVIGILPGMESAILDYRIYVDPKAVDGNNEMEIRCSAAGGEDYTTRKIQLYVVSEIPEFAIGTITTQPAKLLPDTEDNEVKLKIQNIGTGSAELVTAKLILPEGITPTESYSDRANLGTIAAGSVGEAVFHIDVAESTEPKAHDAKIEIFYRDSNGARADYRNQTLGVELNVMPSPIFVVENISTTPMQISQGDSVDIRIDIRNSGFEEAKSVSFKLFKQNDQPFELDEKYDFIGNLGPGETGEALLKITVDDNADLKTHLLEGEVRYIVGNDVFVLTKQVPVRIVSAKESSLPLSAIAVAGVVLLIIIGVYYGRSRKK